MRLISRSLLAVMLVAAATGCKQKPISISTTAYILGPKSNIEVVRPNNQNAIDQRFLNASVLISTRLSASEVKFCTGTLIPSDQPGGNLRVLSNHHCFAEADEEGLATAVLLRQACVGTKVYLGFLAGQTQNSVISDCLPGSLRTSLDGDLSVFRLSSSVPAQFQPLAIADQDLNAAGRRALIVHYPDVKEAMVDAPDGGPKLPLAQMTLDNCKVIGNFPLAHWQFDRSLPYSIKHTCDLTHGSSGSGLIDVATGQLIGVNWGGIKINDNGKTDTVNVATGAAFVNAFLNYSTAKVEQQAASQLAEANAASESKNSSGGVMHATGITRKLGCGVIDNHESTTGSWLLILLGVLPLVAAAVARQLKSLLKLALIGTVVMNGVAPEASAVTEPESQSASKSSASQPQIVGGWGTAYLLKTVFLAEYASLHDHDSDAAIVTHRDRPVHSAEWSRAFFALSALKVSGQDLPGIDALADKVASDPAARANAVQTEQLNAAKPSSLAAVTASFKGQEWAQRWSRLMTTFGAAKPACEVDADAARVLKEFVTTAADSVKQLPALVVSQVRTLSTSQAQCLLTTMVAEPKGARPSYDVLGFLSLLVPGQGVGAQDVDTQAVYAARLLADRKYAESLAVLVTLVDRDDSFRLPYELVQRTYSWRQRGGGNVAIQSL